MLDDKILNIINGEKHLKEALDLNVFLANNPELGGEEYNSSKKIVEILKGHGLTVDYPFAGLDTSFKASIKGRSTNGPKVCLLTEYDALPDMPNVSSYDMCKQRHDPSYKGICRRDAKRLWS